MEVMHPYRNPKSSRRLKECKPSLRLIEKNKRKENKMGLDIYLSKKTFIGAMFDSCGISGIISIKKRGRKIPIKFRRVAYVIEDIYHGRKTHWLHEWLNRELTDGMENSEEYELDEDVINRLHQACIEALAHRNEPDFREICKEKLHCELKPDLSDEALNDFLDEVEELAKATDPNEKTDDAVFIVSASW